jgi:flavodoxin I
VANIGIIYGSTTGNTERVARKIQDSFDSASLMSANKGILEKVTDYDVLLLGSSTWGFGDLEDSWDSLLDDFGKLDLSGKKIGFFGTGDQESYSDTYVDALGLIYKAIEKSGADFIGLWPVDGYHFSESKAVENGVFLGLALDEDNQADQTNDRIAEWIRLVKDEIG